MIRVKKELQNVKALIIENFENEGKVTVTYDKSTFEKVLKKHKPCEITKVYYLPNSVSDAIRNKVFEWFDKYNGKDLPMEEQISIWLLALKSMTDIPYDLEKDEDLKEVTEILNNLSEPCNAVFRELINIVDKECGKEIALIGKVMNEFDKLPKKEKNKLIEQFENTEIGKQAKETVENMIEEEDKK